jgi:hypothetical protein
MAVMEALLKIRADVQGEGRVEALGRAIGGVGNTANKVSGSMGALAKGAGVLSGALGSLVPLATGAGLATMAKGAIDAADDMNDLSQKTGVSVEQLSKFQQAANASGTSIEGVGRHIIKLNRGLAEGTSSQASQALQSLGVSATDASGKLRSTDQVMLDVAERFKTMPDGAQKTALAMQLFGKAGADMIPLLNGGRAAVESLSATMTTEFAQGADSLNDKLATLQGKLLTLAVDLGTALMPALNMIADAVVGIADGFAALPEPIQSIIGGIAALTAAFVVLAPAINAVISLIGIISGLQLGATIAGWAGAIGPLIASLTGSGGLLAALAAVFTGPVGWIALAVAAGVAIYAFRDQVTAAFRVIGEVVKTAAKVYYDIFIKPVITGGELVVRGLKSAFSSLASILTSPFKTAVNSIKGLFNSLLQFVASGINKATSGIRTLISSYNSIPTLPDVPNIPTVSVPAFAAGGVVSQPTLAMVGEAGREYIIPESKMAAAATNYLSGVRGNGVIPAFANGGTAGAAPGGGAANTTVQITTGPVLQQDGQRYVTISDLERALQDYGAQIFRNSRSYGGRRYQGAY